jgi:hypothetical protein
MEEIVQASWSFFEHDGVAAFKLSERSPLPPAVSVMYLPGGQAQILNIHRIRSISRHPVESDADHPPETISDTKDWVNWNGNLDNPNDSISNKCSVCQKHPAVPDSSDSSDGTLYPLTEDYILPVTLVTGRVAKHQQNLFESLEASRSV